MVLWIILKVFKNNEALIIETLKEKSIFIFVNLYIDFSWYNSASIEQCQKVQIQVVKRVRNKWNNLLGLCWKKCSYIT